MIQAKFLALTWGVTASGIKLMQNASISRALAADEKDTVEGQSPTNTKTYDPQSFEIGYSVSTATGGKPLQEWANVQKHVGKRGAIFIGTERIGAQTFMLDSGTFSAGTIAPQGHILQAEIKLKFTEDTYSATAPASAKEKYVGQASAPKAKAVKSSGITMRDVSGAPTLQTTVSAYGIRPTKAQIDEVR